MSRKETSYFTPTSQSHWRQWLEQNHEKEQSVWLILYKKKSLVESITWSQAVDEALCFGWIDSTKRSIDEDSYQQFFTRRKPKSTWSKINKDKVEVLIAEGSMRQAGLNTIAIAKENGTWNILDDVEALVIPHDLEKALKTKVGSKEFFRALNKSTKKGLLWWVTEAKREETRQKRIKEIVKCASEGSLPKKFL